MFIHSLRTSPSHNFENNFSPQEYLPEELKNTAFYNPGKNAREEITTLITKTIANALSKISKDFLRSF